MISPIHTESHTSSNPSAYRSLDPDPQPKDHVLRVWSPGSSYPEVVEPVKALGDWMCVLESDCPAVVSSLFLTPSHQITSFILPCNSSHAILPHQRPKSNHASQPWTKNYKAVESIKPFLLVSLSAQVFIMVVESWPNTLPGRANLKS